MRDGQICAVTVYYVSPGPAKGTMTKPLDEQLFEAVAGSADTGTDLSSATAKAEPRNFLRNVLSLSDNKIAGALINLKLVVDASGAGAFWIGPLVLVRDAVALSAASDDLTEKAVRDPQVVLGQWGLGANANCRPQDRASSTALSKTIVGLVLLSASAPFAAFAAMSVSVVIGLFAAMCFAAAIIAKGLDEVKNA